MIKKLTSFKELPYGDYTGTLLKTEEEAVGDGYLCISVNPKMIVLFVPYIEELDGKMTKKSQKMVQL